MLCGVRPFERQVHAHLISEIARDPLAVTLRPQPLSERASAALLGDEADEAFSRACHTATGGNPLLLVELIKALRDEGVPPDTAHVADVDAIAPRAVSRAVLVRIGRQSRDAATVARATAVLGDAGSLPLVAALAGLDDVAAVAAAGELVGAEVFADHAAGVRAPAHPSGGLRGHPRARARAAARASRPAAAGARRCRRAGRHPARARAGPWRGVGRRRARAGGTGRAASGRSRQRREVPDTCARRAAGSERRGAVLLSLGSAERLRHGKAGEQHLREALELADDPIVRAGVAVQLAHGLAANLSADEAVALARRAAAGLPREAELLLAAFESIELTAPLFGGSEPIAPERFAAHRRLPLAPAYEGGSAAECAPLALAALDGWELIRGGHQIPSIAATMVLELADPRRGLAPRGARGAHARRPHRRRRRGDRLLAVRRAARARRSPRGEA